MNNLLMPTEQKPETIRFTESVVLHPRFEEGFRAINMIHRSHSNRASGQMGMGMIMTGKPGVGKTRLLKFYRDSAQQHSDTRSLATVIIVETPAKRHVTNFYRAILEALGEKNLDRGPRLSTSDMESMILRLLDSLGVQLIIFDEAHNLLPRNGEGLTSTIANSIKQLMNKSKLPMIMVGEDETTELRKNQAAIRSRFLSRWMLMSLFTTNIQTSMLRIRITWVCISRNFKSTFSLNAWRWILKIWCFVCSLRLGVTRERSGN